VLPLFIELIRFGFIFIVVELFKGSGFKVEEGDLPQIRVDESRVLKREPRRIKPLGDIEAWKPARAMSWEGHGLMHEQDRRNKTNGEH